MSVVFIIPDVIVCHRFLIYPLSNTYHSSKLLVEIVTENFQNKL